MGGALDLLRNLMPLFVTKKDLHLCCESVVINHWSPLICHGGDSLSRVSDVSPQLLKAGTDVSEIVDLLPVDALWFASKMLGLLGCCTSSTHGSSSASTERTASSIPFRH